MVLSQNPAERVKARIKALLDKTAASKASEGEDEEKDEGSFIPTSSQREMIEAECFEAADFVSHRTSDKVVAYSFFFLLFFFLVCLSMWWKLKLLFSKDLRGQKERKKERSYLEGRGTVLLTYLSVYIIVLCSIYLAWWLLMHEIDPPPQVYFERNETSKYSLRAGFLFQYSLNFI